uniref:Uncharacterized protein n=1 Tax=Minutocellus polymorphus TaxID=265543 RepID=A0A7S0B2H0_9STRA
MSKKTTHKSTGRNDLGHDIGPPQTGDVIKAHVRGFYLAQRPLLRLHGRKFFEKTRRIAFLDTHRISDTHMIGDDTAYVSVHVGQTQGEGAGGGLSSSIISKGTGSAISSSILVKETDGGVLGRLLSTAATGMVLGEKATFVYDLTAMDEVEKSLLVNDESKICRGQFGSVADDATGLILEVESSRIVRNGKEHCPN